MAPSDTKTADEIVKKYDHRKHTVFMRFVTMIAACFVCMAKMSAADTLTVICRTEVAPTASSAWFHTPEPCE